MATFTRLSCIALLAISCTKGDPQVTSLSSKIGPPSSGGVTSWQKNINALTLPIDLTASCDVRASGVEISWDNGGNWISGSQLSGSDTDCSDKTFTLKFDQVGSRLGFTSGVKGTAKILLRIATKVGPSAPADVTIAYLPSSSSTFVISTSRETARGSGIRLVGRAGSVDGGSSKASGAGFRINAVPGAN